MFIYFTLDVYANLSVECTKKLSANFNNPHDAYPNGGEIAITIVALQFYDNSIYQRQNVLYDFKELQKKSKQHFFMLSNLFSFAWNILKIEKKKNLFCVDLFYRWLQHFSLRMKITCVFFKSLEFINCITVSYHFFRLTYLLSKCWFIAISFVLLTMKLSFLYSCFTNTAWKYSLRRNSHYHFNNCHLMFTNWMSNENVDCCQWVCFYAYKETSISNSLLTMYKYIFIYL